MTKHVNIMGTRGVPARHGGYETFAAALSLWLVRRGWSVTVYCQTDAGEAGAMPDGAVDDWNGVQRVHFTPKSGGTLGTMEFDWRTVRHVLKQPGIDLVLGYNTAAFNVVQRLVGRRVAVNMDGIEWTRAKWSLAAKAWFWLNELVGGNSLAPIADHPEMEKHLRKRSVRRITMIPYGADAVMDASVMPLAEMGLEPGKYLINIGRSVPENSILEIVRAFSRRPRGVKLVVLGHFLDNDAYHVACRAAASDEVLFPGGIFEAERVQPLRFHARAYLHGHTVGGTNPSLCEALGAGNAVIAHDNKFNRWVAGPDQFYFADEDACDAAITAVLSDDTRLAHARAGARRRHAEAFTWPLVLGQYERLLEGMLT